MISLKPAARVLSDVPYYAWETGTFGDDGLIPVIRETLKRLRRVRGLGGLRNL